MHKIMAQIRSSEFLRHNIILFVGSAGISVLNYLYYPVLGRILEPSAFGEVQTIVSLFLQIAIFLNVLALLTVNIVANYDDKPDAQKTIFELERLALLISVIGLVLSLLGGPLLQKFFRFDAVLPFILLSVSIVVSVPGSFRMAYLRGKKLFGLNSWAGIIGAGAKLAFSALLIMAGFGVSGAIAGIVLAQLASFLYSAQKARQAGFAPSLRGNLLQLPDFSLIKPELKYAGLVLAGSLSITALYSVDIIAVKHFFDAHTAGLYAGIATVARIIFFLTGSVSQVLLPSVKLKHTAKQNRLVLRNSSLLLIGLGGLATIIFCVAPKLIMTILMGGGYDRMAYLLPELSVVIFLVSVLNLYVQYFMALRRYMVGVIAVVGLLVTCGMVGIYHDSPRAVVDSMLYGSLFSLGLLGVWSGATIVGKTKMEGIRYGAKRTSQDAVEP